MSAEDERSQVPMPAGTIVLIVGTWASGKSTLAALLPGRLPACVVFDWDLIIPGLSLVAHADVRQEPSTWRGLGATWAAILRTVASAGRDVLLLGPATPEVFAPQELGTGPVSCAYLDWPDATIARRLEERGRSEQEIAEEIEFADRLRRSPHHGIRLAGCGPALTAERVAAWVRGSVGSAE